MIVFARPLLVGALALCVPLAQAVNIPPSAVLVRPVNGAAYSGASAIIPLNVSASDADGTIVKVDFYAGTTLLGTLTAAPYNASMTVPPGAYAFSAKVTDNLGAVTTTATANINVYAVSPGNTAPSVSLSYPINTATYGAPASLPILASASDSGGSINRVEYYVNGSYLGVGRSAPYTATWSGVPAGTYTFAAKAYDNLGVATVSNANTVTVYASNPANTPPVVSVAAPLNGAMYPAPASIPFTVNATDSGGSINRVEFFINNGLLATAMAPPYSLNLTGVTSGSYSFIARAYDNQGAATTTAASTVSVDNLPTVSLTSPASNTIYPAPASFALNATASDSDGSINRVEFYQGSTLLGSDTTSPYSWNLSNLARGSYTFTAKAVDNLTGATTSSPVTIVVNELPSVTLTAPVAGTYTSQRPIRIAANAADVDGTLTKVEFYDGATLIGTSTASPYEINWSGAATGAHTLTAKATDNLGGTKTSAAVGITVNATNSAPSVSLMSPANNAILTLPVSVTLQATAADLELNDGVSKVEFYAGSTSLGSATAAPYQYVWNNPASGSYSLTAKATDNVGAVTSSAAISVVINAPPTVSLSAPDILGGYTAPVDIALTATAADSDGTISKVEIYSGVTLIKTMTASPYVHTVVGAGAGNYAFTAKAYDNRNTTASFTLNVSVSETPIAVTYTYDELGRLIRVQR